MGGELGSLVAARLEDCDWVGRIVGFDANPPRRYLRRSEFHLVPADDRDRTSQIVADTDPHLIVHLGVWEPHARLVTSEARAHTAAVADALFDAAHRAPSLESIVVRSGIEVYGRATWSPSLANETTPVEPNTVYGDMLADIEARVADLRVARGVSACVLRLAPVLGAHVPSPLGRMLRLPAIPYRGIGNPEFCVVEDRDAAEAFRLAAEKRSDGTANIVADGSITILRVAGEGRRVPIPTFGPGWLIARTMANVAGAPVPDHVSDLLAHGRLAASHEAAHLLRFAPRYSTTDVIRHVFQWPSIERIPARRQVA
jgi:UDP-glucose 4-epimerase